ncbi:hypothetical protein LIER_37776 [Lithospermum erythrorhizon]|uniref:Reverse transcriptase Ty1/copia-type domain-containing protein n=1 Tax=Lithospermum erythrorhizon TaxID=34254 RepID=A0AAV3PS32_LITER
MLVYVDDILVTGNNSSSVIAFIDALTTRFVTRDLGALSFFLGIEALKQPNGGLLLSQRQYMVNLLTKANMLNCKPVSTPMATTVVEPDATVSPPDPTLYRQLATLDLGLLITPGADFSIQAFSDADWVGSSSDRRSTGGYVLYLADVLTKPLGTSRFVFFREKLRLFSRPPSACAGSIR